MAGSVISVLYPIDYPWDSLIPPAGVVFLNIMWLFHGYVYYNPLCQKQLNQSRYTLRKLYIIGASHLGREMAVFLKDRPDYEKQWKIEGFLHDVTGKSPLDGFPCDHKIIAGWSDFQFQSGDMAVVAIGDGAWRSKVMNSLNGKVEFPSFVHPSVRLFDDTTIGEGSMVWPGAILSIHCHIGRGALVNYGAIVSHDVAAGDFSTISPGAVLTGGVQLGEHVEIGSNATVLPRLSICAHSIIGAGATVVKSINHPGTYVGTPAKILLPADFDT